MELEMVNTDNRRLKCEVDVLSYLLLDLMLVCGTNETTTAFKDNLVSKLDTILGDDDQSNKYKLKCIVEAKSEINAFANSRVGQRLQRNHDYNKHNIGIGNVRISI